MEKKNLRRLNLVVTSQTLYHLRCLAAAGGAGERGPGACGGQAGAERRTGLEGRNT